MRVLPGGNTWRDEVTLIGLQSLPQAARAETYVCKPGEKDQMGADGSQSRVPRLCPAAEPRIGWNGLQAPGPSLRREPLKPHGGAAHSYVLCSFNHVLGF